ncbi:MAG: 2-hydroxyacid dehydrogenase [Alphaproteobacteria bacterium]|nr:2-hydroxyacid dehydrogenase [Alphaproteobacteria bacterium]
MSEAANTQKILYFSHGPEALYDILRPLVPAGFELLTLATGEDAERYALLAQADALLVGGHRLHGDYIAAAPRCKLVQLQGVGYHDLIDTVALKARGIPLAIDPAGTAEGVSEHALMLMLAVTRHLAHADAELRQGRFESNALRPISRQIRGKTVGIVGMGRIGKAVAGLLQPFDVRGLYCDPYVALSPHLESELGFHRVGLDTLLAESDIVTLHVPITDETRHMINTQTLARMKPHAFLVNTSRGPVVDQAALVSALTSGRLLGAGLDVFEREPPEPGNPLFALRNVVLTPHMAAGTSDALLVKMQFAFANIARFFRGEGLEEEIKL